ncbi:MAG: methyltransferase domain-containing protein [Candidatus Hydrogenedentes bacterium]|nr:methyltransferase domain-containing protein [Candidatus Hydrogenedentota bacterium]
MAAQQVSHGEAQFDSWSDYYQADYGLPQIHRHLTNMAPFIRTCESFAAGPRFLEIGTGTGLVSVYFSQCGHKVTGLDYDQGILALNRAFNSRFCGQARFLAGDLFALPFKADSFDLCFHQGLMEHFDPAEITASLQDQVRIARRVVFSVPTVHWKGGVFGNERMMTGAHWMEILKPFRVLHLFGGAFADVPSRALNFAATRFSRFRPQALYRPLALHRAGELGFVIEAR